MKRMASILVPAAIIAFSAPSSAQWWNPLAPADYEECAEQAAKDGKTQSGLGILLQACQSKFQARRNPNGKGYRYYDSRMNRWLDVDGPTLSANDKSRIEDEYRKYWTEKLARETEERERERREKEAAQRQWKEYEARTLAMVPLVRMVSQRMECSSAASCTEKTVTVAMSNGSSEVITGIYFGWAIYPSMKDITCPSQYPDSKKISVDLPPGKSATFTFSITAGPQEGLYRYCLGVVDVSLQSAPAIPWGTRDKVLRGTRDEVLTFPQGGQR